MEEIRELESSEETPQYDEAALLKYISNLTTEDIDKLVSILHNRYNQDTKELSKSMTEYMDLINSVFNSNFNSLSNSPQTRKQRYEIYDEMDESTAYISSALDILSDDATQPDDEGTIIHVISDSQKIVSLVNNFIEEFELEDKVSKWARATAKYGDLFLKVDGSYGKGISYINDTIYPSAIERRDLNGKLVAFTRTQSTSYNNDDFYAPWEFIHFRHKGDIYKDESRNANLDSSEYLDNNLTSAYGQSVLRPAIKVYAQLRFVENMLLLSRLTNSIRRNIFLINVGEVAPEKALETINNYAKLLKKNINLNIEDSIYSSSKHTVNYDEDIFIPVNDPQNDVRIEQVGGDANIKEQYDLDYLQNKLFSALKIPKAYLNYEQDLNARSTLVQLDIRYARSVAQLQNTVVSGLKRLINTHLAYLGLNPSEIDLDIQLTTVSAIDAEAKTAQMQAQVSVARDVWELLSTMQENLSGDNKINLQGAAEYVMQNYLELDQDLIDNIVGREHIVTTKLNSSKKYSVRDLSTIYPSTENEEYYEHIRESLSIESSPICE